MEYRKKFYKIKKLLPYFMEFSKDRLILFKKYFNNYIVKKPNKWLIIMIIYNETIVLANNRY